MWVGVQIDGTRQEYPSLSLDHEHLWDTKKMGHAYRAYESSQESEVKSNRDTQESGPVTMPCYQEEVDLNGTQYHFTQIGPPPQTLV